MLVREGFASNTNSGRQNMQSSRLLFGGCGGLRRWLASDSCLLRHANCRHSSVAVITQAVQPGRRSSSHRPSVGGKEKYEEEDYKYWEERFRAVDKPAAKAMMKGLDMRFPLGVPPSGALGQKELASWIRKVKLEKGHPQKVVVVRIGEFYETSGWDAVLMVEHCGLNPMGDRRPPQAGFRAASLERTLQDLQLKGLDVAVVEEVSSLTKRGKSSRTKERSLAGVHTAASPYVYNKRDQGGSAAQEAAYTAPICAVSHSVSGYKICMLDPHLKRYDLAVGQTEDAVFAVLHKGGIAPPLYLHSQPGEDKQWQETYRIAMKHQGIPVKAYTHDDFVSGLQETARRDNNLDAHKFNITQVPPETRSGPQPLFNSTAVQLGIIRTDGLPNLLDYVVPAKATTSSMAREYLNRLLMKPPPTTVAHANRAACKKLRVLEAPLPSWTIMDPARVANLICEREVSAETFRDLHSALGAAIEMLQEGSLQELAMDLLPAVNREAKWNFEAPALLEGCKVARDLIGSKVLVDTEVIAREVPKAEEEGGPEVMSWMLYHNEEFRGKIKDSLLKKECEKVQRAGEALTDLTARTFNELTADLVTELDSNKPKLKYDAKNKAVYFKILKGSQASKKNKGFINPRDKGAKSKPLTEYISTVEMEAALEKYRDACTEASDRVSKELKSLAEALEEGSIPYLTEALVMGIVASAFTAHVEHALTSGWALPEQLAKEEAPSSNGATARQVMHIKGMWPYWKDGSNEATVLNDLDLDRTIMLTGPNMAGKSTLLRSVCAIAVLAACGLHAPVHKAVVPFTDAFMLRTFSADNPAGDMSSFRVEMNEMRNVKENLTKDSLVLVDELGKGTEPSAGAAIAASFLEDLGASGCRCLFATHLHQLLDMEGVRFDNVGYMCMELRDATQEEIAAAWGGSKSLKSLAIRMSGKYPTMKIIGGSCCHSLAIVVMAQEHGEEDPAVKRAHELYQMTSNKHKASQGGMLGMPAASPDAEAEASSSEPEAPSNGSIYKQYTDGMTLPSPEPSSRPLELVVPMLKQEASHIYSSAAQDSPDQWVADNIPAQLLRSNQNPPPTVTEGCSCVYVLREASGWFYVGETDGLKNRFEDHGLYKKKNLTEAIYTRVPDDFEGKSTARCLEQSVTKRLLTEGYPLRSLKELDGQKRKRRSRATAANGES